MQRLTNYIQRFIIDIKKQLKKLKCKHKNRSIIVIDGFAEWEETALLCNDCKKQIIKNNSNKLN